MCSSSSGLRSAAALASGLRRPTGHRSARFQNGYSRNLPLERMARDARMVTIGGGTAQILRTVVASRILERKLPQTRDGFSRLAAKG